MATNPPKKNSRRGAVKDRSQTQAPNGNYVKRDTKTGKFLDQKTSSPKPFKRVRKEKKKDKMEVDPTKIINTVKKTN